MVAAVHGVAPWAAASSGEEQVAFTRRLVNRLEMPTKHVLVVEDDLHNQAAICIKLAQLFGHQGKVQVSVVPGAEMAASSLTMGGWSAPLIEEGTDTCPKCGYHEGPQKCKAVDLVLLDHDLPYGNGVDLLEYVKNWFMTVPVITFSGIDSNNDALMSAGANYKFSKQQVLSGEADQLIRMVLGL